MQYLTPQQVSAELAVSTKTLEGWRHKRSGPPFVKIGRLVRYRRCDLDNWLHNQSHGNSHKTREGWNIASACSDAGCRS
jgi:excisionase family DNA binding protein